MAQDFVVQPFFDKFKVKRFTFENSNHVPMWEKHERFMQIVGHLLESED